MPPVAIVLSPHPKQSPRRDLAFEEIDEYGTFTFNLPDLHNSGHFLPSP